MTKRSKHALAIILASSESMMIAGNTSGAAIGATMQRGTQASSLAREGEDDDLGEHFGPG